MRSGLKGDKDTSLTSVWEEGGEVLGEERINTILYCRSSVLGKVCEGFGMYCKEVFAHVFKEAWLLSDLI